MGRVPTIWFVSGVLVLSLVAVAARPAGEPDSNANPREVVEAAVHKLADLDNYSLSISDSDGFEMRPVPLVLSGTGNSIILSPTQSTLGSYLAVTGKFEKSGLSSFVAINSQRVSAKAFRKGEKIILADGDNWKVAPEIILGIKIMLSPSDVQSIASIMSHSFNYATIASRLLDHTEDLKYIGDGFLGSPGNAYVGRLTDGETLRLVPPSGGDYEHLRKPTATITFVVNNDILELFDIDVKVDPELNSTPLFNRGFSAGLTDIGYTTIVLPESAATALGMPLRTQIKPGLGKIVGLDYFYNYQTREGKRSGYTWDNIQGDGYSQFGEILKQTGASLATMDKSPTLADLDKFSVYIIVSPCTVRNAADHRPRYIMPEAIDAIVSWVHNGGILAIFANGEGDCEFEHLNQLARQFGFAFNGDNRTTSLRFGGTLPFEGKSIAMGMERVRYSGYPIDSAEFPDHVLFQNVRSVYMKELTTLDIRDSGQNAARLLLVEDRFWPFQHAVETPIPWSEYLGLTRSLTNRHPILGVGNSDNLIAVKSFGKGLVFAVGSPWFHNSGLNAAEAGGADGNLKAANNLATWLMTISSTPKKDK